MKIITAHLAENKENKMDQLFGGVIGIVIVIFLVILGISWLLFPIWIYSINQNVRMILENMDRNKI